LAQHVLVSILLESDFQIFGYPIASIDAIGISIASIDAIDAIDRINRIKYMIASTEVNRITSAPAGAGPVLFFMVFYHKK